MRGALCRSLLRSCSQQKFQVADVARVPVRQMFWWVEPCLVKALTDTLISRWGHDTLEDKEERKRQAQAKGVIAWTDPDGALQEKKEFVWSPQRIEDEANNAIEGWLNSFLWILFELLIPPERERRGVFSPADLLYYIRNRLFKPYLPMAVIDPVWFREETKKKSRRLVLRCFYFWGSLHSIMIIL